MLLLLRYHLRSVLVRWRSTLATVLGIALVVAVFILVQSLAAGLEKSSANTGDPRNLLVARKGALSEATSLITREQFNIIRYLPGIAVDAAGRPLASADLVIIINLPRRDSSGSANVLIRGVSPAGIELRPQVTLLSGRWFQPGNREVVVSSRLSQRFAGLEIGQRFRTGSVELTVVGVFDGARTAFDSEVWLDADEARECFDREDYSSILLRTRGGEEELQLRKALEEERRLKMKAVRETDFYAEQTRTAGPIKLLGDFLAVVMSVGAVFAAMNTLYASIGARTREIGTLRVLGYRRRTILTGFLIEGAFLAFLGGLLGCLLALPMHGVSTGTIGWETFAERVFDFQITTGVLVKGLVFAVLVGLAGSILPAFRAARLPVISSLRAV